MRATTKHLQVRVPASTANLGSGFDSIGVAFQRYLELSITAHDQVEFLWDHGDRAYKPFPYSNEDNLILRAMKKLCTHLGEPLPAVQIIVRSEIPSARGLGSSAAAYVAGLIAMNAWLEGGLDKSELLWLAAEEEGHADNVGASIFGGVFCGAMNWEQRKVIFNSLEFPVKWCWLAAIPAYSLSTLKARQLLPDQYKREDTTYNLSRYGLLVSSILLENEAGMLESLQDRLHQPYRQALIPGFEQLVATKDQCGALGFMISGAGPAVLGLFKANTDLEQASKHMQELLTQKGQQLEIRRLAVDQDGAQVM